jgi:hypothetical protein
MQSKLMKQLLFWKTNFLFWRRKRVSNIYYLEPHGYCIIQYKYLLIWLILDLDDLATDYIRFRLFSGQTQPKLITVLRSYHHLQSTRHTFVASPIWELCDNLYAYNNAVMTHDIFSFRWWSNSVIFWGNILNHNGIL